MVGGVETGYQAPSGESGFLQELRTNTEVFAAFKAHRMGRDMASQLLDENGNVKTFQQFKKDTEGIVDHHVNAWLRTEYDTAIRRAHRAAEVWPRLADLPDRLKEQVLSPLRYQTDGALSIGGFTKTRPSGEGRAWAFRRILSGGYG